MTLFFFACNDALVRSVSCLGVVSSAGRVSVFLKLWWMSVTLGSRNEGDKNPIWFTLGMGEVLKGWDKGLKDMCTGERRKLTVPPSLAYGKEGKGDMRWLDATNLFLLFCSTTFWLSPFFFPGKIPSSSTLIFDIELMDIKNGPRSHDSFKEMDLNDDWKLSKDEVWNPLAQFSKLMCKIIWFVVYGDCHCCFPFYHRWKHSWRKSLRNTATLRMTRITMWW